VFINKVIGMFVESKISFLFDRYHDQIEKVLILSDLERICDQIDVAYTNGDLCDLDLKLLCKQIPFHANKIKTPIKISYVQWVVSDSVCDCCGSSDLYIEFCREICSTCHPRPNLDQKNTRYAA